MKCLIKIYRSSKQSLITYLSARRENLSQVIYSRSWLFSVKLPYCLSAYIPTVCFFGFAQFCFIYLEIKATELEFSTSKLHLCNFFFRIDNETGGIPRNTLYVYLRIQGGLHSCLNLSQSLAIILHGHEEEGIDNFSQQFREIMSHFLFESCGLILL